MNNPILICVTVLLSFVSAVVLVACEPAEPPSVSPALPFRAVPAAPRQQRAVLPSAAESQLDSQRPRPACFSETPRVVDAGTADASLQDGGLPVVRNAEMVIAQLRRGFRACYNKQLAVDPLEEGCATIVVRVAPDGSVASTDARHVDGLSSATTGCVESVLRDAHFDPPGGVGAVLQVPTKFVRGSFVLRPPRLDAGQD